MEIATVTINQQRDLLIKEHGNELLTYSAYHALIEEGHQHQRVTGHEQSESLLQYSLLNAQRMSKWDKHYTPSAEIIESIESMPSNWKMVVIVEGWCGDAAQIVPALKKIVDHGKSWTFSLILRDDNQEWMKLFLTNQAQAVPIAILFDEQGKYIYHWGPRPKAAVDLIANAKANNIPIEQWKIDLHKWYAFNKQTALEAEWKEIFNQLR